MIVDSPLGNSYTIENFNFFTVKFYLDLSPPLLRTSVKTCFLLATVLIVSACLSEPEGRDTPALHCSHQA